MKRVDGEVSALSQRIKALDENLAKSEQYIKTATAALADAVAMEVERRKNSPEEEEEIISDPLSQFDAQMAILEGKLLEAKFLASKASTMSTTTISSQVPIKSENNNEVIVEKPIAVVAKLRRPFPIEDSKPAAVP